MEALREYLRAGRGRQSRLAEALGISPSAVSMWERVPTDRLFDVERATGIPRNKLRPDLYPEPLTAKAFDAEWGGAAGATSTPAEGAAE